MAVQFLVRVNLALVREHLSETGMELTPSQLQRRMSGSGFSRQPAGWWLCAEANLWMLRADEILEVLILPMTYE